MIISMILHSHICLASISLSIITMLSHQFKFEAPASIYLIYNSSQQAFSRSSFLLHCTFSCVCYPNVMRQMVKWATGNRRLKRRPRKHIYNKIWKPIIKFNLKRPAKRRKRLHWIIPRIIWWKVKIDRFNEK